MAEHWEHGLVGTYTNHRCRCDACRAAHAAYQAQRKAARRALLAENPDAASHGVATTYSNWGCRCPRCTAAWREVGAERNARRKEK